MIIETRYSKRNEKIDGDTFPISMYLFLSGTEYPSVKLLKKTGTSTLEVTNWKEGEKEVFLKIKTLDEGYRIVADLMYEIGKKLEQWDAKFPAIPEPRQQWRWDKAEKTWKPKKFY
jgi:hypothetical protein